MPIRFADLCLRRFVTGMCLFLANRSSGNLMYSKNALVAIVVPHATTLLAWAAEHKIATEDRVRNQFPFFKENFYLEVLAIRYRIRWLQRRFCVTMS